MNAHTQQPPAAVLTHFATVTAALTWSRAPDGFSGATVWRGDDPTGMPRVAIKAWPPDISAERLQQIHAWLSLAAKLPFIPGVFAGAFGQTAIAVEGQLWDATRWMPGEPRTAPTAHEVCAACEAVARLHLCWPVAEKRPCRGVATRLELLTERRALYAHTTLPPVAPELDPLLRRAQAAVACVADGAIAALRPWAAWPLAARTVVRDLRGEHILFEHDRVTGVIDFGAMAVDHVAVDLARLLDDYAGADENLFCAGLNAYREAGGPLDAPDEFVRLLARTGRVCSVVGWLVRLIVRREPVLRPRATAERLAHLVRRVEADPHFGP